MCVCVQGRPDWRLLIKGVIAAKDCLVINIGLSDSREDPVLLMCTVEKKKKAKQQRLPNIPPSK